MAPASISRKSTLSMQEIEETLRKMLDRKRTEQRARDASGTR
jgi:hypothetical protein